jgi:hypothetical protein
MCTPEAYIASRVLQGYTQYRSDKAKANQINRDTNIKAKNLREEAIYTDSALIRKQEVTEDQTALQKEKIATKKLQVEGTAKATLGERNVGGNLEISVLGDIARNAGKELNVVDQNYENQIRAIGADRLAYNRRFTNQILKLPRAYKPSFMTYALSASVDIGSMYMANQAPSTPNASSGQTFNLTYENYNPPK